MGVAAQQLLGEDVSLATLPDARKAPSSQEDH
jgi:hypothetical protein